jgi:hypothetical protein
MGRLSEVDLHRYQKGYRSSRIFPKGGGWEARWENERLWARRAAVYREAHLISNSFCNLTQSIEVLDSGESFPCTAVPHAVHIPLPVRAPEVIFQDQIDHVDLWSMGCMLQEIPTLYTTKLINMTALWTFHWPATYWYLPNNTPILINQM